eukprot:6723447-Alexandrium_andersonii.AAC.1
MGSVVQVLERLMPLRLLLRTTFSQQAMQAHADADAGRTAPNVQQPDNSKRATAPLHIFHN